MTDEQLKEEVAKAQGKTLSYIRIVARLSPSQRGIAGYRNAEGVLESICTDLNRLERHIQALERGESGSPLLRS